MPRLDRLLSGKPRGPHGYPTSAGIGHETTRAPYGSESPDRVFVHFQYSDPPTRCQGFFSALWQRIPIRSFPVSWMDSRDGLRTTSISRVHALHGIFPAWEQPFRIPVLAADGLLCQEKPGKPTYGKRVRRKWRRELLSRRCLLL
jgi:hypothetical protein